MTASRRLAPDKRFDERLNSALAHHRSGQLDEAEKKYRAALALRPANADALHYLGILKLQQQQAEEAFALISKAVTKRPQALNALCNLSAAQLGLRRYEDAIATCDRILAISKDDVETLSNRANALMQV